MPMHMVAFAQNGGFGATGLNFVTPVPDPTITINGFDSYVPNKYNKIVFANAVDASGFTDRLQLQSPSLRSLWYPDVTPAGIANGLTEQGGYGDWSDSPLPLDTNEGLRAVVDVTNVGATPFVGIIYADDKITPTTGKIWTMRAAATPTLVTNTWINGPLVFDQPLPVGDYDVVGMRVAGTGIVLARLVFIGASAETRPGVFAQTTDTMYNTPKFRMGKAGVWGTFNSVTPPSVDFLGVAGATTAHVYLDLIPK